jgi:hypothetical protein
MWPAIESATMTLEKQFVAVGAALLRTAPAPVLVFAAGVLLGAAVAVAAFHAARA